MKWMNGKKVLAIAMLGLVTASVAGCHAPYYNYRRYAYYDHDQRDYRRYDHRRDDDRRHDRYDWRRDHDRWRHDRDR